MARSAQLHPSRRVLILLRKHRLASTQSNACIFYQTSPTSCNDVLRNGSFKKSHQKKTGVFFFANMTRSGLTHAMRNTNRYVNLGFLPHFLSLLRSGLVEGRSCVFALVPLEALVERRVPPGLAHGQVVSEEATCYDMYLKLSERRL